MVNGIPVLMPILALLYFLVVIGLVVAGIVILWRWMRAHERIADSMAGIERALADRPLR